MTEGLGFPHPGPLPKGEGGKRRRHVHHARMMFFGCDAGCVGQKWLIRHDASIACMSWSGKRANAIAVGEDSYGREPQNVDGERRSAGMDHL